MATTATDKLCRTVLLARAFYAGFSRCRRATVDTFRLMLSSSRPDEERWGQARCITARFGRAPLPLITDLAKAGRMICQAQAPAVASLPDFQAATTLRPVGTLSRTSLSAEITTGLPTAWGLKSKIDRSRPNATSFSILESQNRTRLMRTRCWRRWHTHH